MSYVEIRPLCLFDRKEVNVLCRNTTPLPFDLDLVRTTAYEQNRTVITNVSNYGSVGLVTSYGYNTDALGRRTNRLDVTTSLTVTNALGYNLKSEVTSATMANGDSSYEYDSIGNRVFAALNAATNTYTANLLNQYTLITNQVDAVNPIYDLDGNMLTNGVFSFTWDGENRLEEVYSNDVLVVSNVYDDQSRRIRKVTVGGTR